MRRIFSSRPAPAPVPDDRPAHVIQTERALVRSLDAGELEADDIVDWTFGKTQEFLEAIDPMTKARMIGIVSDEINAIDADPKRKKTEKEYRSTLVAAGQDLVIATQVPEQVMVLFRQAEKRMIAGFEKIYKRALAKEKIPLGERISEIFSRAAGEPTARQLRELNMTLTEGSVHSLAKMMNNLFAKHFDIDKGLQSQFFHAAKPDADGKLYLGWSKWDEKNQQAIVETNTAFITTLSSIPSYLVTLGHEGLHGILKYQHLKKGKKNLESIREKNPEYYMLMRVTDKHFYTYENENVYRWHPEEILAQRVGIGIAIGVAKVIGLDLRREDLLKEATMYAAPEVRSEIFHRLPSRDARFQPVDVRKKSLSKRAISWAASTFRR